MRGTIVCGVTDSGEGRAAAKLAAAFAARLDLRLVLVHVMAEREGGDPLHGRPGVQATFERIAHELGDAETRFAVGNRVEGLVRVAAEEGADAIVVGSRARGSRGHQLRCTLVRDLEAATAVPVLIAPPMTRERGWRRLALAEQGR